MGWKETQDLTLGGADKAVTFEFAWADTPPAVAKPEPPAIEGPADVSWAD